MVIESTKIKNKKGVKQIIIGKYNEFPYWGEKETNINIAYEEGKFNTIACGMII